MIGFIVEKRPSYGGDFEEIASFQEVSQLISKGAGGGRCVLLYQYTILLYYTTIQYIHMFVYYTRVFLYTI